MTAIEQTNVDESIHHKSNSYLITFRKQTIMAKFLIVLAVLAIMFRITEEDNQKLQPLIES